MERTLSPVWKALTADCTSQGCCVTTGTCHCKNLECFSLGATDREKTGSVMCLKHKGGVNHSAVARRHKSQSHTHTQNVFTSILSAYSAAQRQQLRITLPRSYSHAGRERGCFSTNQASAANKKRLRQLFTGASRRNTNKQTLFTWPSVFTLQSTQSALRGAKRPWRVRWL